MAPNDSEVLEERIIEFPIDDSSWYKTNDWQTQIELVKVSGTQNLIEMEHHDKETSKQLEKECCLTIYFKMVETHFEILK